MRKQMSYAGAAYNFRRPVSPKHPLYRFLIAKADGHLINICVLLQRVVINLIYYAIKALIISKYAYEINDKT